MNWQLPAMAAGTAAGDCCLGKSGLPAKQRSANIVSTVRYLREYQAWAAAAVPASRICLLNTFYNAYMRGFDSTQLPVSLPSAQIGVRGTTDSVNRTYR